MQTPYDPQTPYNKELTIALHLVRLAIKLSLLGAPKHDIIDSVVKDDSSPVTAVDIALQESSQQLREDPRLHGQVWTFLGKMKAHCESLRMANSVSFPLDPEDMCDLLDLGGHGSGIGPQEKRQRTWIMDPIDGTKAFIRGLSYAINVALLDSEARQVLAVIGCPRLDPRVMGTDQLVYNTQHGPGCIVFALRGHGTHVQEFISSDPQNTDMLPATKVPRLPVPDLSNTAELRWMDSISIPSAEALQGLQRRLAGILSVTKTHQEESSAYRHCDIHPCVLKWVFMALGNAQAWSKIWKQRRGSGVHGHGMVWDFAGPMLQFEEVGGKVTDLEGRPIDLSTGRKIDASHGSFVSAPVDVHAELLSATRRAVVEMGRGDLLGS